MNRKLPTEKKIREFWAESLWKTKGFDSKDEFLESGTCFACGMNAGKVERAHILARSAGGGDTVDNLHMLCKRCHKDSELLSGEAYNQWLIHRNAFDMLLSNACRRGFNLTALLSD